MKTKSSRKGVYKPPVLAVPLAWSALSLDPVSADIPKLPLSAGSPEVIASAPCGVERAALESSVQKVRDKYGATVQEMRTRYAARAADIKRDADEAKPSDFGAITKFDIDISWKDQEFIFDTPTVIIKDQKIILDLPETVLKEQHWIYDLPASRLVNHQTGEFPEFRCDGIFDCTVKWSPIIVGVPEFYMERHDTILGVPEFSMGEQAIFMGVPEFRTERQRIVLGLPQITIKNVTVEAEYVKRESDEFAKQAGAESQALTQSIQNEMHNATAATLHDIFQCERTEFANTKARSLADVDAQIATAMAAAEAAKSAHAEAQAKTASAVVQQLVATRATIDAKFAESAEQFDASERRAMNSLEAQQPDNPPVVAAP